MNRTLLVFLVMVPIALGLGAAGEALGIGSWAMAGIALVVFALVALIDRDGFYGRPPSRSP